MIAKIKGFAKFSNKGAIILIAFIIMLVYANSLVNKFVWDDHTVIVDNNFVKSLRNFPSIFTSAYLTKSSDLDYLGERNIGSGELSYRPVVTATYFFDYAIWKLNPLGYHLDSLLIHILNTVLLYALLNLIVKDGGIALLASLLFALNPVNTEAVDVISFREDLLAALFVILSFIFFVKSQEKNSGKGKVFYLLSIATFLLALFSKEMAVTLPLILILFDYFFISRQKVKNILYRFKYYLGFIAAVLLYFGVSFFIIRNINKPIITFAMNNFYTRILTMFKTMIVYIQWMVFPVNIHPTLPDDPALISNSLFDPVVLFSIVAILSLLVIAIKLRRKNTLFSFSVFWVFIALIPVSNIFFPLTNYMAARYLYLPGIGFSFLIAAFLIKLPSFKIDFIPRTVLQKVSRNSIAILLIFYSMFTIIRNLGWKNDVVLWSEMIENYPNNALAHSGLGSAFRRQGSVDKAIGEYKIALNLDPNRAKDHNALGICYYEKKMFDEAIEEYKKALKMDPYFVDAYANLGSSLGNKGLYQEAIRIFEKAIQLDGQSINAYNGLGVTHAKMKRYDEARKIWGKALAINPDNKNIKDNLNKISQLGY